MYYIGSMQCDPDYIAHYGKKGMHWGQRKYQNLDGSLTPLGREHYGVGERQETRGKDIYEKQQIRRMNRAYNKISRIDRRVVDDPTRRQSLKLAKAQEKYRTAQSNLDKYHNASEKEQRKARNSIRIKRAGMIAAGAITAAGAAVMITAASKHPKFFKDAKWWDEVNSEYQHYHVKPGEDASRLVYERNYARNMSEKANRREYLSRIAAGTGMFTTAGAGAATVGFAAKRNRKPMTRAEEERKKRQRDQWRRAAREFDGD